MMASNFKLFQSSPFDRRHAHDFAPAILSLAPTIRPETTVLCDHRQIVNMGNMVEFRRIGNVTHYGYLPSTSTLDRISF